MAEKIMYVDKEFKKYIDDIRKKYNLTYPQVTKLIKEKLQQTNFNGEIEETYNWHKKRRYIKFEL